MTGLERRLAAPTRSLCRGVVGVASGGVVGRVEDLAHGRSEAADGFLDALLERHVGGAAALAASAEAQVHVVALDVDELDEPAVLRDGRELPVSRTGYTRLQELL